MVCGAQKAGIECSGLTSLRSIMLVKPFRNVGDLTANVKAFNDAVRSPSNSFSAAGRRMCVANTFGNQF